ncbi:MAG: RagB/SusD family nutrient uptake outer membrane protein, partial [Pseudobacter sp.]|uniref:RagB/SusD family nutrient uptake outer membrane protein n=1 Tax=Pseudobacter sp. TaxID=2045420 RepID=UPI003F7CD674
RQPGSAEVLWNFAPAYGAVAAGITSVFTGDGGHYNPAVLKAYGLPPQSSRYDLSNYLSDSIVNEFAANDKRKLQWLESMTVSGKTYYFPFKYKTDVFGLSTVQEYPVVMRMGEVFLIRAEARIRQEKIEDGIGDINKVRFRASLGDTTASTKETAMGVLEREKRLELFTEWGHRWFDLKRWPGKNNPAITRAEEVMSVITPLKGGTWEKNWLLLPLPQTDIINNPFLKQNEGYQ